MIFDCARCGRRLDSRRYPSHSQYQAARAHHARSACTPGLVTRTDRVRMGQVAQ